MRHWQDSGSSRRQTHAWLQQLLQSLLCCRLVVWLVDKTWLPFLIGWSTGNEKHEELEQFDWLRAQAEVMENTEDRDSDVINWLGQDQKNEIFRKSMDKLRSNWIEASALVRDANTVSSGRYSSLIGWNNKMLISDWLKYWFIRNGKKCQVQHHSADSTWETQS